MLSLNPNYQLSYIHINKEAQLKELNDGNIISPLAAFHN